MSEKKKIQIQYINLCINKFAKRYGLAPQTAFKYLAMYSGIDFLTKHYEAEHVLPIEDTIDSLHDICHRNGGAL